MKKDYHIHAMVVQDPKRAEQFVERAIALGFGEICITDHMPLSISDASDRIPHGRVKDYCDGVRALARKYEDRISVKLGIEVDYHPSVVREIEDTLGQETFDYVLGSSHLHLFKDLYFSPPITRNQYVSAMLENTMRAAESGYFDAIAHMDMYRWVFTWCGKRPTLIDDGFSEERHCNGIEATLRAIRENGLRLEINSHFAEGTGALENTYPSASILRRALAMDLRVSYGSDAHKPESVGALWEDLMAHPVYGQGLRKWEDTDEDESRAV